MLCALPLLLALGIWAISRLLPKSTDSVQSDRKAVRSAALPLLSLVAVPLVIVVFSAVVQSALIPRYAISATLVVGAVVALLGENLSRSLLVLLALLLSGFAVLQIHSVTGGRIGDIHDLSGWRDELLADHLPIVFADRADAVRFVAFDPDLASRVQLVDQRQPGVTLKPFRSYEIAMIIKMNPIYALPPLITRAQLGSTGPFHFIGQPFDLATLALEEPLHHLDGDVYENVK
jgi:hypothetical protein